jgi:hypothetical protein
MMLKSICALSIAATILFGSALAHEGQPMPRMTMGNGEANSIQMDGVKRIAGETIFSENRADGAVESKFRANSTAIVFPQVVIEKAGWLVLHPVIDGRPNGDMVSGYTYLSPGQNKDVTIRTDHPVDPGDKFLVMLHHDVNQDRVFDFVFVADGINVEDTAVSEGTRVIAHIFAAPE